MEDVSRWAWCPTAFSCVARVRPTCWSKDLDAFVHWLCNSLARVMWLVKTMHAVPLREPVECAHCHIS